MKENKSYCDTSKLSIRLITKSVAKDIIVNNHYSGLWTKVSYAIGLFTSEVEEHPFFNNVEDKLIGVACYGDPIGRSAGQYGVRSIPFVVVEKDGEVVQSVVGAQSEMTYSNILKGLL